MHVEAPRRSTQKQKPSQKQELVNSKHARNNSEYNSQMKAKLSLPQKSGISESQITTSSLRAEVQMIEQKLDEVALSHVDERSDLEFSQMQSQIPGITASEISGINSGKPISDKKLISPSPYRLHNNTIHEVDEKEDNAEGTRTQSKNSNLTSGRKDLKASQKLGKSNNK